MLVGIFGTGRNGSSLLMRLLDGSPDLWVHPVEMNYLSVFSDLRRFGRVKQDTRQNATTRRPLHLGGELDTERLLGVYAWHFGELTSAYVEKLADPLVPRCDPAAGVRGPARYSAQDFLPAFLESVRAALGLRGGSPRYLVFKSIETPFLGEYERVMPQMRFVHIIRDPLASYSSLKRTNMVRKGWPFWEHGGDELRMFLEKRWLPHARFVLEACVPGSPRHLLLRYEDLCERPKEVVSETCRWLGVAPPADLTLQTALGGLRMAELPPNPSAPGVPTPARVVANLAEQFGYEEVLTQRERDFILRRTHDQARRLGYLQLEPAPSRRSLARRWILPDRWELRNAGSKARLACALVERRWYIYRSLLTHE